MKSVRMTPEQYKAAQEGINKRLSRLADAVPTVVNPKYPLKQKYGNVPTDGKDSKKEAKRGKELRLLQKAGEITELQEQVKFTLVPRQDDKSGKCIFRAVTYTLDYQYRDRDGVMRYEDVKGYANDRWPMKRALMLWIHDILVEEV